MTPPLLQLGRVFLRPPLVVLLVMLGGSQLQAQSAWEVTPYKVWVWVAVGEQPNLPTPWVAQFSSDLDVRLRTTFRAIWDVTVSSVPEPLRWSSLHRLEALDRAQVFETDPTLLQIDKLFVVTIEGLRGSYRVQVREIDCRLGYLGPTDTANVDRLSEITGRTAQLIERAFSPIVLIDRVIDQQARVRLRAGSLIRGDAVPGTLQPGDLLLPFDRRVGRTGETRLDDIRPVDWTYLTVPRRAPPDAPQLLEIVSGFRQPFRSKRSRRQEQLAMRARPRSTQSTIRLRSRAKDPQPLVGYEIHEKGTENTEFLGYTDYRGELAIPVSRRPIRLLLVKSGDRVTAKLPIVPGLREVVVASMLDDRQRVETDGFLSGIQTALIDLVARRESLAARIRRRIAAGDLTEARQLLNAFRKLPTQDDFRQQIQQQQQAINVTDTQLRKRIDTMFVDAYRTLGQYLDPGRLRQLEAELAAAEQPVTP